MLSILDWEVEFSHNHSVVNEMWQIEKKNNIRTEMSTYFSYHFYYTFPR